LKLLFPHLGLVRYPIKFIIPTVFALPLLAAFGIQKLCSERDRGALQQSAVHRLSAHPFLRISVMVAALLIIILLVSRLSPYPDESWITTWQNGIERALVLALCCALVISLGRTASVQKQRWLGFA